MKNSKEKEIKNLIGKEINFGEILGKYSEVSEVIKHEHIGIVSEDQEFLKDVKKKKIKLEFGYNPFKYYICLKCSAKINSITGECEDCKIKEWK